jgi:hypothetical protein
MSVVSRPSAAAALVLALGGAALSLPRAAAQPAPAGQKVFATPDAAVQALHAAVKIHDKAALREIFGPLIVDLLTGDEKQDKANSRKFAAAIAEGVNPVSEGGDKVVLEIGAAKWPFPIPLVKESLAWRFDTAAGKEEIINRHVGKDELHAIGFCAGYVSARNAGRDVPLPKTFHGYSFKTLAQPDAGAGAFALAAYPEHWGKSGVMTFVVAQDGKIYRRDLGEKTAELAAALTDYKPDGDWSPETDQGVIEK